MNSTFVARIIPLSISLLVLLPATGCVVYKNPVPPIPPPAAAGQWPVRYPFRLGVRNPPATDFNCIWNENEGKRELAQARAEAQRLATILSQCHLFNNVVLAEARSTSCDLTIEALPRIPETADNEKNPWMMFECDDNPGVILYGTIIPLYFNNNLGVRFKFLQGAEGEFRFKWTEETIVGFWAPVVGMAGKNWQFQRSSGAYWNELRSVLIERFDRIPR